MFHNLEAEQAILGAILIDYAKIMPIVSRRLYQSDFYVPYHQAIYDACLKIYPQTIDIISISDYLRRHYPNEQYTAESLMILPDKTIIADEIVIANYVSIIKELSIRRQLYYMTINIVAKTQNYEYSTETILNNIFEKTFKLLEEYRNIEDKDHYTTNDLVIEFKRTLDNCSYRGLDDNIITPTGIIDMDKNYPLYNEYILLGGRPSMGKTTLARQWAWHIAKTKGPVIFFSFEVPRERFIRALICYVSGIKASTITQGVIDDHTKDKIATAIKEMSSVPLILFFKPMSSKQMLAEAMKISNQYGSLAALFCDRLELIDDVQEKIENRTQYITKISKSCLAISTKLSIPCIILVQLSRSLTSRKQGLDGYRPTLSDLRDSGALEQDAKKVIFIHREEYFCSTRENQGKAELIIAKNMFGKTGKIKLCFREEIPGFYDLTERNQEELYNNNIFSNYWKRGL